MQRARELVPVLQSRAENCERLRRLPPESIDDLHRSELVNVCKTKAYGGFEYGWDVFCEMVMELAKGCGSTAWVYSVYGEHALRLSNYPAEAQADVWGQESNTLISSGNSGQAELEPVAGGYRLSGIFNYSSGSDYAGWHITGVKVAGAKERRQITYPASDRVLEDNWHVVGLAGTGSKDVVLHDVFIPEHRTYVAGAPGDRHAESSLYRLPQWSVLPFGLTAVPVGVAQGALDRFIENIKTRSSRFGDKIADFQSLQLRIAESAAELDAARRVMLGDIRESQDYLEDHDTLPIEMLARNKRDMAYCCTLAQSAVDRIFYASGAAGLALCNDIQRSFRDVNAGISQLALNWDVNGTTFGKIALGLETGFVRW